MPDELITEGQNLRDEAALAVDTQGSGLWVGRGDGIETELQLTGRKVKDYHCECAPFAADAACQHLAALLAIVHLRKAPKVSARPKRKTKAVTTKRLIATIHDDELRDFVRTYAARHPEFALDLRIRFAHDLPSADRFEQVLSRLLKRSSSTYSAKQLKRISEALEQFSRKREEWLAEKMWLDLFELNTTLVSRMVVLVGKEDRLKVDLYDYLAECIGELGTLVRSSPPPVLIERIQSWLDEEAQRGVYGRSQLDEALFGLAAALGESLASIRKRFDDAQEAYGPAVKRVARMMALYYAEGETEKAEKLLLNHLDEIELVLSALQAEITAGNIRRAVRLAEAALEVQHTAEASLQLRRFLIGAAETAKQPQLVVAHGPSVVLATQDFAPLENSMDWLTEEQSTEVLEATLDAIEASSLRQDIVQRLRAKVILKLGRYPALATMLYASESEVLNAEMLPELIGKLDDTDLSLLVETKVREQLNNRFGNSPAVWTAQLLDELARRSRSDFVQHLAKRIRKDFRQRKALTDALDTVLL